MRAARDNRLLCRVFSDTASQGGEREVVDATDQGPAAAAWDDAALERALFPPAPNVPAETRRLPDFAHVHRELKRKGVTLFLLWEEYKAAQPDGFGYSWFRQHYRTFAGKVDAVMRQTHRAGQPEGWRDQAVPVRAGVGPGRQEELYHRTA